MASIKSVYIERDPTQCFAAISTHIRARKHEWISDSSGAKRSKAKQSNDFCHCCCCCCNSIIMTIVAVAFAVAIVVCLGLFWSRFLFAVFKSLEREQTQSSAVQVGIRSARLANSNSNSNSNFESQIGATRRTFGQPSSAESPTKLWPTRRATFAFGRSFCNGARTFASARHSTSDYSPRVAIGCLLGNVETFWGPTQKFARSAPEVRRNQLPAPTKLGQARAAANFHNSKLVGRANRQSSRSLRLCDSATV